MRCSLVFFFLISRIRGATSAKGSSTSSSSRPVLGHPSGGSAHGILDAAVQVPIEVVRLRLGMGTVELFVSGVSHGFHAIMEELPSNPTASKTTARSLATAALAMYLSSPRMPSSPRILPPDRWNMLLVGGQKGL